VSSELELRRENVYALTDGTRVSQWEHKENTGSFYYILPDKQTLLRVDTMGDGYDRYFAGMCPGWAEVDGTVREAILNDYTRRGTLTLPDGPYWALVCARMEEAYSELRDGGKANRAYITETVEPVLQNDRLLVFSSKITTPRDADGAFQQPAQFAAAPNVLDDTLVWTVEIFDRGTGERLPVETLFSVPAEEASARLAELCARQAAGYLGDFVPLERVVPENECLRVWFTAEETGFIVSSSLELDYGELTDLLQPWAMPV